MNADRDELGHNALEWYDDQLTKDECTVTRDNFHMFVLGLIDDLLGMKGRSWTSVNEMMPPDEYGVLVTDGERVTTAQRFMSIWTTHEISGHDSEVAFDHCVTHWMPLPEPPAKEKA